MSQAISISVDVRFHFQRLHWEKRRARVVGYEHEAAPRGTLTAIPRLGGNEIALKLLTATRYGDWQDISTAVFAPLGSGEPSILTTTYPPASGPFAGLYGPREFDILIAAGSPVTQAGKGQERQGDAWKMRDEFLALPNTDNALVRFLNKWGKWNWFHLRDITHPGIADLTDVSWFVFYAAPELIWERQRFYKAALSGNARDWLAHYARVPAPKRVSAPPFLAITDEFCEAAIETTITMDKLRDVPFRICERPDCGKLFELKSRRAKQFCSYECAHLTAVRRGRQTQRDARQTSKGEM